MSTTRTPAERDGDELEALVGQVEQLIGRARARLDGDGIASATAVLEELAVYARLHLRRHLCTEQAMAAFGRCRHQLEDQAGRHGQEAGAALQRARCVAKVRKIRGGRRARA